MVRIKITPPAILAMADIAMIECQRPEPSYHQRNGWACKQWFDERNAIADEIVRKGIFA